MKTIPRRKILGAAAVAWAAIVFLGAGFRVLADCASFGLPFTDLGSETTFCAAIAEAYYTGITAGTSATTFSPGASVTREQAVAFSARALDAALTRGSRRAALGQWWTTTPHYSLGLGTTVLPGGPSSFCQTSDGSDIWIGNSVGVTRVHSSDGSILGTWTASSTNGLPYPIAVLAVMGKIVALESNGDLDLLDPTSIPGPMSNVASGIPGGSTSMAFDGSRIWIATDSVSSSVGISVVMPANSVPWPVTSLTYASKAIGILFDGKNIWATFLDSTIKKLDDAGGVVQSVPTDVGSEVAVFDGRNIWVPNVIGCKITVVDSIRGAVLRTIEDNVGCPTQAAFDGQRVLVLDGGSGGSIWNASTLDRIGSFTTDFSAVSVSSDGLNFWVGLRSLGEAQPNVLARF
jgi:hypothetical protein